ncbi:MAG TPA: arylsulfotransferase family protein [Solirubrobacteraceae bacterium]|nr:arylsulfotransferase family protein [Solirubrobacteraceae bacterium]
MHAILAAIAASSVVAFPAPGAGTALRGTEISLRGVTPAQAGAITVSGSRSGPHTGTLQAHPDGNGVSFVPATPFDAGERVTVETALSVRDATNGDYSFTVARGDYLRPTRTSESSVPRPRKGTFHAYRSDSIKTPRLVVTRARRGRAAGYLVLNTGWTDARPRPDGVLIADDRGRPVWFQERVPGTKVFDVGVQTYRGRPVLTYWQGSFAAGWGYGEYVLLDDSYREVARIAAVGGNRADIHDMTITPEGTALVPSYSAVRRGGRQVLDNVIQEIDIATGRLLFEWHSLDAIRLSESRDRPQRGMPFDYFHLNSIEVGPDGDLLVSARNTCAVYEIDRETGAVNWRLGGEKSDFRMGRGTRFCRQHDARWAGGGTMTLFDNHVDRPRNGGESRGLRLSVNQRRKTVRLLRGYPHPRHLAVANKGSARQLSNGNLLVGWGAMPFITEFTRHGRIVFDAHFAKADDGTYRAIRARWQGRPTTPPPVAADRRGDRTTVWASWNGATEVARWRVLAGDSESALEPVATRSKRSFETAMALDRGFAFVAVEALDADGAVLGRSRVVTAR